MVTCLSGCPDPVAPETQTCSSAERTDLGSFTVRDASYETDVVDGGDLQLTYGDQGGAMFVLQYHFDGATAPGCLIHETTLELCSDATCDTRERIIGSSTFPLPVFGDSAGWRTSILFLILDEVVGTGSPVMLETTLGSTTQSVTLSFNDADG